MEFSAGDLEGKMGQTVFLLVPCRFIVSGRTFALAADSPKSCALFTVLPTEVLEEEVGYGSLLATACKSISSPLKYTISAL